MTILESRSLSVSYGHTRILEDVDLQLQPGEILGLIGPNGAGKTTLIKTLANLLTPTRGEVRIDGRAARDYESRELARILAYLPQGGSSQWPVSVETLVMLGRLPHRPPWGPPDRRDLDAVDRALEACDVAQFRERPANRLSGGELARVLLARVLCTEPRCLLVDEPVVGLDPGHQLDVMEKLRDLAAAGAGIILVVHDLTLAARFCHRAVLLHQGRVAARGEPGEVLSADNLARFYGIQAHRDTTGEYPVLVPVSRIHHV